MPAPKAVNSQHRALHGEQDALRLRQLLIDGYTVIGREFNWEPRRWEGHYWAALDCERNNPDRRSDTTHLWETVSGELVGAVVAEGPGDVALIIHPDYRKLEDEMIEWATVNLAAPSEDNQNAIEIWAFDWDEERQQRLRQQGFSACSDRFYQHRRRWASEPMPDPPLAEGYALRSVADVPEDDARWVACSNATFGQSYTPEIHRNFMQNAPSNNYDLHIIAEAPDGSFAAFAGLTVEPVNRYAVFEPVGTHPEHRRKGLAQAAMYECIRRVQALGTADVLYVASWGTSPAGKFYENVGMAHYATQRAWRKVI
ncbi:MAG: GNAT family N-acetyltransferase [Anaerolineae bacterium]|nr:GNAT family N-acetyltransferase [Anaerolineae bacterium]